MGYNRRVSRLLWIALVVVLGCGKRGDPPAPRDAAPVRDAGEAGTGERPKERDADQRRFFEERRPDLIVAALGLKPGVRVADVGAGSGLLTVYLARAILPGGKVVATDVTQPVIDLLTKRVIDAELTDVVEPRLVDPDKPGLEPGSYDAILLAEVDNYFADPTEWLKAAKAALKPGGAIAITNRVHHRARGLAAAKAAGLHLDSESTPVPSTFIAVFHVEPTETQPTTPPSKPSPSSP